MRRPSEKNGVKDFPPILLCRVGLSLLLVKQASPCTSLSTALVDPFIQQLLTAPNVPGTVLQAKNTA